MTLMEFYSALLGVCDMPQLSQNNFHCGKKATGTKNVAQIARCLPTIPWVPSPTVRTQCGDECL